MTAKIIRYWDYDELRCNPLTCPYCRWTGPADDNEDLHIRSSLLDVVCPACDRMLFVVPFPTVAETQEAADNGNPRAAASLPDMQAQEKAANQWSTRARASLLRDPDDLPELDGDHLVIDWDQERVDDDNWTVLRHGHTELWRELAYWEGIGRFAEVVEILRLRYGPRLAEVRPTPTSEPNLWGDRYAVDREIEAINASLREKLREKQ
jgi:hypothetical protein